MAIGNPFGLGQTATLGIVRAFGRRAVGSEGYEGSIQTDASTNPGNSGGPLVNEDGVVVGINRAIIGPAGGSIGIGFAVPAETVAIVMRQLILNGKLVRGEVGLITQDLTPGLAKAFGVDEEPGALVSEVHPVRRRRMQEFSRAMLSGRSTEGRCAARPTSAGLWDRCPCSPSRPFKSTAPAKG